MGEWQPIETAPRDGTQILLFVSGSRIEIGSWHVDRGYSGNEEPTWLKNDYDDSSTGYASTPLTPLYWMPLPEAPAHEGGA